MRLVFMGTPDFAVASLNALMEAGFEVVGVVTAADKPAGRGQKLQESAVKQYAVAKGLKVLQPLNAILPMTYSVAGFKAVVSSGDFGVMWQNAGILLGFSIVFMVGTWLYFMMKYKRQYAIFNETEEEAV